MTLSKIFAFPSARAGAAVVTLAVALLAGCKFSKPGAPNDQQISSSIQSRIQGEAALNGQNIQVSFANGVATLNGTVTDDASRALAANDSAQVNGVKTVVNNLTVQPALSLMPQPESQPAPEPALPMRKVASTPVPAKQVTRNQPPQPPRPPQRMTSTAPPPAAAVAPPPPAPEPPKPVVKTVTLPAGTVIPIRLTEELSSQTAQSNDVFHGSVASGIGSQGVIAIPAGASVMGRIIEARNAARIKGSSFLSLELTQLNARGKNITLVTDTFSKEGSGRGKNTAAKAGGGAALGAIIGGLAGGGKGAAIGGLAGAAAGTGVNAATRGEQVTIPSETLINFQLQSPITINVTVSPSGEVEETPASGPQLQSR